MVSILLKYFPVLFVFIFHFSHAQVSDPVSWLTKTSRASQGEMILTFSAALAPGWHLYSQHMKPGGPIPTRFRFNSDDDYLLTGVTQERGEAVTFHDDLYDLEVTWYADLVIFSQLIKVVGPVSTVTGTVEYMVCNYELCIPNEWAFSVPISP